MGDLIEDLHTPTVDLSIDIDEVQTYYSVFKFISNLGNLRR